MIDRRVLTAALTATALGVGAAAPAMADTKYDSKIRVANSFPAFHGKVRSDVELCVENRKVIMYSEMPGDDDVLGKTRTDGDGKWKVKVEPTSGVFYAKVRKGGSASLGIVCRKAVSKPVVID